MMAYAGRVDRLFDAAVALALERARSRVFWQIQAMVLPLAVVHSLLEYLEVTEGFEHFHHVPVVLFIIPIVYAGMRFGWEGALLTGLWAGALTIPNVLFWHRYDFEWLVEILFITVALGVGVIVAMLAEQQRAERRRAEKLARRLLQAHEEERRRIARELHDGPVQTLVYLLHDLARRSENASLGSEASNLVANTRSIVGSVLDDFRSYSRDLRPSILDDLGLVPALEWLARSISERHALRVDLQVTGAPTRLPPPQELALFRIAQEALHNVERHAGATHAQVELAFGDRGAWRMRVRDDGRGFAPGNTVGDLVADGHLGLHGMYERAELVGARLDIRTAPGRGTTIDVFSGSGVNGGPIHREQVSRAAS